ncbi:MAG: SCO family protein [Verrucomicrobia bacterium]|nr:MAG: SCO family protein [Verrucomicrobiota bacterium]
MPVRLGPMLKIIPSSSPSPRGRRDRPSLSFPRGRDGRETPVRAGKRVGVRVIGFLKLLLVFLAATAAAELSRDSEYDYDPPAPGSYSLPVVKSAADGALLDSNNKAITLRDLTHGRITVLSFIYTRCAAPKACPYATGVLSQIHDLSVDDKTLAKSMRLVSISFDPEYDTPQRLAAYSENVREQGSGCEWRFVTSKSRAELEPILAAYDQAVDKRQNPADPQGPLYHTLRVFLIDREGRIRNIYSSGTLDPRLVVADVKTLLLEESRISTQ